jgi:hypothetical protein
LRRHHSRLPSKAGTRARSSEIGVNEKAGEHRISIHAASNEVECCKF